MSARIEWYDADDAAIDVVAHGSPVIDGREDQTARVTAEAALVMFDVNGYLFTAMEGTRDELRERLRAALASLDAL